jgi:hypothetical protein
MAEVAAELVINSVIALLQSVAEFDGGKVFYIRTEQELKDKLDGVVHPAVGVLYDGMRGGGSNGPSHKTGLSGEITVSLLLAFTPEFPTGSEDAFVALRLLDRIRKLFADTRSPTGHFWRFIVEAPAVERDTEVLWIQRWATPVQLSTGTRE